MDDDSDKWTDCYCGGFGPKGGPVAHQAGCPEAVPDPVGEARELSNSSNCDAVQLASGGKPPLDEPESAAGALQRCERCGGDSDTGRFCCIDCAWIDGDPQQVRDTLRLILPMAKGYASEHPVGHNADFVAEAEAILAAADALAASPLPPVTPAAECGADAGLALVTTTCFECGHDLEGPWCPACNPPSGWRDIASAPLNGTPMLAASVNHDAVEVVCWQDGPPSGSAAMVDGPECPEEGWVNDGPCKDRFHANPLWFTHWMPLPSAPEAPATSIGGSQRESPEGAEPLPASLNRSRNDG